MKTCSYNIRLQYIWRGNRLLGMMFMSGRRSSIGAPPESCRPALLCTDRDANTRDDAHRFGTCFRPSACLNIALYEHTSMWLTRANDGFWH